MGQKIFICLILFYVSIYLEAQEKDAGIIKEGTTKVLIQKFVIDSTKLKFDVMEWKIYKHDTGRCRVKPHETKFSSSDSAYLNNLMFHKFDIPNYTHPQIDFKYRRPHKQKYYFSVFDCTDMPNMNQISKNEYPFNWNRKDLHYLWPGDTRYRGIGNSREAEGDSPAYLIYFIRKNNKIVDFDFIRVK